MATPPSSAPAIGVLSMARLVKLIVLAAIIGVALARRECDKLDRLHYKDKVEELHWFYNTNLDSAAALGTIRPFNDTDYQRRLQAVIGVFCPDPIFDGWVARGGPNGDPQLAARRRNAASPNQEGLSVEAAYGILTGQFIPGQKPVFLSSSQHLVSMPIIDVYYDDDNVLHADVNATLAQWWVRNDGTEKGSVELGTSHYNNKFIYYDPPGQGSKNALWCMKEFNALNTFTITLAKNPATGEYRLSADQQLTADNYLSAFVRPGVGPN